MHVHFEAEELHGDGRPRPGRYAFRGGPEGGWTVERGGGGTLRLGPGFRLLRTERCGVCSTDLARHHLPFPLPQVIGHELVARDAEGRRLVVEINASHRARGLAADCPFCRSGLSTHCPERRVLGIHDLPGGFGPWVLAPVDAALAVPDDLPDETAVLVEPFAAALHAVETVDPREGDTVCVLGPRRLGLLVVAALSAWREREGRSFEILALSRREALRELALALGADAARRVHDDGAGLPDRLADVVIDTTGNPAALPLALRLARREVHVKSTHGRPAAGLARPTEMVVDELWIDRLPSSPEELRALAAMARTIAWTSPAPVPPAWRDAPVLRGGSAAELLARIEAEAGPGTLPRADLAVAGDLAQCDAAIRPVAGREVSLVRPRGGILLDPRAGAEGGAPLEAALGRGTRLTSSRCGDFRRALDLLAASPRLCALGERLVTHVLAAGRLAEAFELARSPECIKAVVEHPEVDWPREGAVAP